MSYSLHVKIRTKPLTRLLKVIPIPFLYVHGHNFKISITIKNFGPQRFNGGRIWIRVTYAFGNLNEEIEETVQSIDAHKERVVDSKEQDNLGVLANGHALFWAELSESQSGIVRLFDEKSKPLQLQHLTVDGRTRNVYQVHSFYSLTRGEIYTLTALYVNVLLVILANWDKLAQFITGVWEFITRIIN